MSERDDRDAIGRGTQAVWAGEEEDLPWGATTMPVVHSVTYSYDDLDQWFRVARGEAPGHIYSRNTNPTVAAFDARSTARRSTRTPPTS